MRKFLGTLLWILGLLLLLLASLTFVRALATSADRNAPVVETLLLLVVLALMAGLGGLVMRGGSRVRRTISHGDVPPPPAVDDLVGRADASAPRPPRPSGSRNRQVFVVILVGLLLTAVAVTSWTLASRRVDTQASANADQSPDGVDQADQRARLDEIEKQIDRLLARDDRLKEAWVELLGWEELDEGGVLELPGGVWIKPTEVRRMVAHPSLDPLPAETFHRLVLLWKAHQHLIAEIEPLQAEGVEIARELGECFRSMC